MFEIGMKLDDFLIQLVKYCFMYIYKTKNCFLNVLSVNL